MMNPDLLAEFDAAGGRERRDGDLCVVRLRDLRNFLTVAEHASKETTP